MWQVRKLPVRRKPLNTNGFKISPISRLLQFITHPVAIFCLFQLVWISLTILWVLWYLQILDDFSELGKIQAQVKQNGASVAVLVSGLILLGVMLIGSIWLFIIGQKRTSDFKQQQIFVSSVTHELRSPLASLLLTFETLKRREPPEEVKQTMIDNGVKDCERLLRLVNQILLSARLDRGIGSFDEKSEAHNLVSMIKQASKRAEVIDPKALERIKVDCPESLMVDVPQSAFLLLLSNLIENAVKYSPEGEYIYIHVFETDSEKLRISVIDKGFGLEKAEIKKVFRMFHRGSIAKTKAIKGTGVGLFIVKSISKLLGATVWAESEGKGKGSRFHIDLPVAKTKLTKFY